MQLTHTQKTHTLVLFKNSFLTMVITTILSNIFLTHFQCIIFDTCVLKNGHAKWPLNIILNIMLCWVERNQSNICPPTKRANHSLKQPNYIWNWTSFDKELLSNKTYTKGTLTTLSNSPIASHQLRTNHFYVYWLSRLVSRPFLPF